MAKPLLSVQNVSKEYSVNGKVVKRAVNKVSFDIQEAEIFALLGVNGAGKTTLSSMIASIHPPTSGDIKWMGKSIYEDLFTYRKHVGFCPQKPNLDKRLSLSENLYYAGLSFGMESADAKARVQDLLDKFTMREFATREIDELSGGYRQRFLIARTLMHRPKLILLDEPTVGLDPDIRNQFWDIIRALKEDEGASIILTTHYLGEAEAISDRVCIIENGKKVLIDTPKQLKKDYKKKNLEDVFLHLREASQKEGGTNE